MFPEQFHFHSLGLDRTNSASRGGTDNNLEVITQTIIISLEITGTTWAQINMASLEVNGTRDRIAIKETAGGMDLQTKTMVAKDQVGTQAEMILQIKIPTGIKHK